MYSRSGRPVIPIGMLGIDPACNVRAVRPRIILLIAPLVAGALLAGCGAGDVIDNQKTQIALRFDIEEATGTKVEKVTCPADVPVTPGTRFNCLVTAVSGDEAVANLEITSTAGDLKVLSLTAAE